MEEFVCKNSEYDVVKYLTEKHLTLFTAESCTGGLVCKKITDVAGASAVLLGGIVVYTDEMKIRLLGVAKETIEKYTAVSKECAFEMAQMARHVSGADIGISATGYASAGASVPENLTGTVYIGYSDKNTTFVNKLKLNGSRFEIRETTANSIFEMIIKASCFKEENK